MDPQQPMDDAPSEIEEEQDNPEDDHDPRESNNNEIRHRDNAIMDGDDEVDIADRIDAEFRELRVATAEELPPIMGQNDPRRMRLTREEKDWALDIKEVMEELPEINNLSDFWYAQYAIICKDNIDDAVHRALELQAFREEYKILDTHSDGIRRIHQLVKTSPERFMSLNFSQAEGTYIVTQDLTKVDVAQIGSTPEKLENWFAADFYLHNLIAPDLDSIRKGDFMIVETEGFRWAQKRDNKLMLRLFTELIACYPFCGTLKLYNTGTIFNSLFALCRMVLPADLKNKIQVSLKSEDRLDTYFLTPSVEEANRRMLATMEECLQRRYANEKSFKLDD